MKLSTHSPTRRFRRLLQIAIPLAALVCGTVLAVAAINQNPPIGGSLVKNLKAEPPNLHPITSGADGFAVAVQDYVFDSLAARDLDSLVWKPRMADRWELSKDGKVVTFFLRQGMTFDDGKAVTAEDVKFSFDAIFDKAYNAAERILYFENIEKVEVVDPLTVRFRFKNSYYLNFLVAATMYVIPKHIYGEVEKSKKLTKEVHGSGPYVLEKFEKGQKITLKRNPNWYGFSTADWKGSYNFETIIFRFIKDESVSFEMLKKGELDYEPLSPEFFLNKTNGEEWGKSVYKVKTQNSSPKRYYFIGWNQRKQIFQDRNVRLALAHLMNREEMIKKFRFDMSEPAAGPVYNQSVFASPKVKPIPYDPAKAVTLLTKAGWKDVDKNGVLEKTIGGKKVEFKFKLIYPHKDYEKYWVTYKEDLKKVGIEMELDYLEWQSFLRVLDGGQFDSVALAWGGTLDWDPKQIWHSSSIKNGGSNFVAYSNPKVDRLIDEARMEVNESKRIESMRRIYELIAEDAPYAFLFNEKYSFYGHSSKVSKASDTLKYDVGVDYWWSLKP